MAEDIIKSFCLWCDLLGYGAPFIESNWDLTTEKSLNNLNRINKLKECFKKTNFFMAEKALMLNDGIIRNLDLVDSEYQSFSYISWFERTMMDFHIMNYIDKKNGFYGSRAVLTCGHRYMYMSDKTSADYYVQASQKKKDEYYSKHTVLYSPKEFQMNTAFSKAYIIESKGSSIGLSGANFYIDEEFLIEFKKYLEEEVHKGQKHVETNRDEKSVNFEIQYVPIKYRVNFYKDKSYLIWEIVKEFECKDYLLFKLWLDADFIELNDMGINTKIYRAIKFKPTDEEDFIYELENTD